MGSDDAVFRGGRGGSFSGRVALALGIALAGKTCGLLLYQLPVLSLLAFTSVVFVVLAVLFGWTGLAAAGAVHAALILWRDGQISLPSLAAYLLAGAIAWVVMRHVPRLGRGFPDLRSLGWFAAATAAGAVLSSSVITLTSHEVLDYSATLALWSRSTTVTLWVFGPPLILIGSWWLRPWLAPIPGEPYSAPPREVRVERHRGPGTRGVAEVETREIDVARTVALSLLGVAAITVGKLRFSGGLGHAVSWWNLLYFAPVYVMADRLGIPGGLLGAGVAGGLMLLSLIHI